MANIGDLINGNALLPGQVRGGNVNLRHRQSVPNPEGGMSTVFSMSFGETGPDGKPIEVLIPRVANGRVLSEDDAIAHYKKTGQHLGKFSAVPPAEEMGQRIHRQQEMEPQLDALIRSMGWW